MNTIPTHTPPINHKVEVIKCLQIYQVILVIYHKGLTPLATEFPPHTQPSLDWWPFLLHWTRFNLLAELYGARLLLPHAPPTTPGTTDGNTRTNVLSPHTTPFLSKSTRTILWGRFSGHTPRSTLTYTNRWVTLSTSVGKPLSSRVNTNFHSPQLQARDHGPTKTLGTLTTALSQTPQGKDFSQPLTFGATTQHWRTPISRIPQQFRPF